MASSSSFFDIEPLDRGVTCHQAMDACSLCGKRLAGDRDIFMYRGDTPFCSEECRYHQIMRDETIARNSKSLKDHSARKEQRRRHETPTAESGHVALAADVPVAT